MEKMPLDDVHVDELLSQMVEGRYVELYLEVGNPPHARARGADRLDELKLRLGLDTLNPYESLSRAVAQRLLNGCCMTFLQTNKSLNWRAKE